eukprot:Rmarinus@m.21751
MFHGSVLLSQLVPLISPCRYTTSSTLSFISIQLLSFILNPFHGSVFSSVPVISPCRYTTSSTLSSYQHTTVILHFQPVSRQCLTFSTCSSYQPLYTTSSTLSSDQHTTVILHSQPILNPFHSSVFLSQVFLLSAPPSYYNCYLTLSTPSSHSQPLVHILNYSLYSCPHRTGIAPPFVALVPSSARSWSIRRSRRGIRP